MANLAWRNKVQQPQQSKTAEELIQDIAKTLALQIQEGIVSLAELDKINELAANATRLKTALSWL